ncbi:MAG TPA: DegT/DnrJ/EryC1/StrS family aminotransferase [Chitinophagales bacterium]|nr:DegT/DnrJ/EryC1/StrS family aminotransferase [Chitinophagales bacterium]
MKSPSSIQMVDLQRQYQRLSKEIDVKIQDCLQAAQFIQGQEVRDFEKNLGQYLSSKHVISCGNGTDALMLACMALGLQRGDKVIVPAFTYIASVEILKILGLEPVYCDVNLEHFMLDIDQLNKIDSTDCKAIIVVHLYGQSAEMEEIMNWANARNLYVIEDNAQAIGATCEINGQSTFAGTIGHIGTTSFFPSKNLGAFGDGGAIFTPNEKLAQQLKMMANHGQSKKYIHEVVGVNSRLDTIQAGILNVKLKHLDEFTASRRKVAERYDQAFSNQTAIKTPFRISSSTHVFHQYTIQLKDEKTRNNLQEYLKSQHIPSVVYYPIPVYHQKPYFQEIFLPNTEVLCQTVLSLPIHTEMTQLKIDYICEKVNHFFDV